MLKKSQESEPKASSPPRTSVRMLIAVAGALALTFGTGSIAAAAHTPETSETSPAVQATQSESVPDDPATGESPAAQTQTTDTSVTETPQTDTPASEPVSNSIAGGTAEGDSGTTESEPSVESLDAASADAEGAEVRQLKGDDQQKDQSDRGEKGKDGKDSKDRKDGPRDKDKDKDKDKDGKVTLCHATGHGKGWETISPNVHGAVAGHAGIDHQSGLDIIPPFTYEHGEETVSFPGQNWDAQGQEIWHKKCQQPPKDKPAMELVNPPCVAWGGQPPTTVAVTVSGIKSEWGNYKLVVKSSNETKYVSVSGNGEYAAPLSGFGSYTVMLKAGDKTFDTKNFTVKKCPHEPKKPTITVDVEQCVVPGGETPGTVLVSLDKLQKGSVYIVQIEYLGDKVSTQKVHADGHTAQLEMAVAGAGDFYTATVIQKGSKHSASTEFQILPCPPPELTISGEGGQCVALGGEGTVIVRVGGMQPEQLYEVNLWFGEELVGTQTVENSESGAAELTFAVMKFGTYMAQVSSVTDMAPAALMMVSETTQSASVEFQAGQGCPVPATPAMVKTAPPTLAVTGADSPGSTLLAVGLLLALGGAAIAMRQVRRTQHTR